MATKPPTKPDDASSPAPPEGTKAKAQKGKPDPADKAKEPPEQIAPNPVEANEPYPTGSPPDPAEAFKRIHGYDRPKEA